tara:strand:- start:384 stop:557 length:174 start_codon:yes stop_codon:yes gene_type:complete
LITIFERAILEAYMRQLGEAFGLAASIWMAFGGRHGLDAVAVSRSISGTSLPQNFQW